MLLVGDDWAEDHHDVELQDQMGRRLARARLPEGVAGVARLHELISGHLAGDAGPGQVAIGIETDRGPWVQTLIAAGYTVYAINPRQVARYRERHGTSGAKSDAGDAHTLADMVRTDRHQLRAVAGDSEQAQAVKVVARAHQTLIWERHRHMLRLRTALREFFPAALEAFDDLTAPDVLELLAKASDPASAARLSRAQIAGALKRARRRQVDGKAAAIQAALRTTHLTQPPAVAAAYAATVRSLVSMITAFNDEIAAMEEQVKACFGQARDAEIYLSQPGLGQILAARALGEFGDDEHRYATAKNRKNYAGTSPITRASGKKKTVLARYIHNDRLVDALHQQAFCALTASPGVSNRGSWTTLRDARPGQWPGCYPHRRWGKAALRRRAPGRLGRVPGPPRQRARGSQTGMTAQADDELWSAIADPSRRLVLDLVVSNGDVGASWPADRVPFSRQAVAKHLTVLERAGLVSRRKQGREVLYRVKADRLDQATRALAELAAQWDRRLAAIKRLAEAAHAENMKRKP